ncbi:UNVERIFIED_CONTAM: hypothetical protein Sradi_4065600 [Sesamum radiatum]|uniref:Uncharacterized protein n=1 Tax=Sesamum radiatum TaxID=300843 RepID=A0AAW2PM83_SESRA
MSASQPRSQADGALIGRSKQDLDNPQSNEGSRLTLRFPLQGVCGLNWKLDIEVAIALLYTSWSAKSHWYKELNDKRRKGAGRGRGFAATIERAPVRDEQLQVLPPQGSNFSFADIMRTEIRKFMMKEVPTAEAYQMRTPFDNVRANCVRLEEIEEAAGNNLCFNFRMMDGGS